MAAMAAVVLVLAGLAGCGGTHHVSVGDPSPAAVQTVTATVTASPTLSPSTTVPSSSTASGSSPASPPSTYAEALAHIAAGHPTSGETTRFTSPSGGIYCALAVGETSPACELTHARLTPPAGSHLDCTMIRTVGRVELGVSKAAAICNTDTIVTPGAPTLGYGEVATTRDTECVMERIGVTCVGRNGQGAGFFLSAEGYQLFG
jgi:hypothetical protein